MKRVAVHLVFLIFFFCFLPWCTLHAQVVVRVQMIPLENHKEYTLEVETGQEMLQPASLSLPHRGNPTNEDQKDAILNDIFLEKTTLNPLLIAGNSVFIETLLHRVQLFKEYVLKASNEEVMDPKRFTSIKLLFDTANIKYSVQPHAMPYNPLVLINMVEELLTLVKSVSENPYDTVLQGQLLTKRKSFQEHYYLRNENNRAQPLSGFQLVPFVMQSEPLLYFLMGKQEYHPITENFLSGVFVRYLGQYLIKALIKASEPLGEKRSQIVHIEDGFKYIISLEDDEGEAEVDLLLLHIKLKEALESHKKYTGSFTDRLTHTHQMQDLARLFNELTIENVR